MDLILQKYDIRTKDNLYNLNDIVKNIIESKSEITYMNKIQEKTRIQQNYYVSQEKFLNIIKRSRKPKCIEVKKMLKSNVIVPVKPEVIDNNFTFNINDYNYMVVDNEIWFKGKDIAAGMGYSDTKTAIIDHVDTEFKLPYENLRGGEMPPQNNPLEVKGSNKSIKPNTIFISEPGVYALVASSKLPKAKAFQKWLFKEVLPSIRKTGSYSFNKKKDIKLLPDVNEYEDKNCFYLLNIDEKKYKFGISQYIKDRINSHKRDLNFKNIVKIWTMNNFDNIKKLEKKVKNLIKQWEIQYNDDNQLEWFQINDNVSLQNIIDKIDQYIDIIESNSDENNNDLLIQKEITKQKKIELEKEKLFLEKENVSLIKSLVLNYKSNFLEEILVKHFKIHPNNINVKEYETKEYSKELDKIIIEDEEQDSISIESDDIEELSKDINLCMDCNIEVKKDSSRCNQCSAKKRFLDASKDRPSYTELINELKETNYTQVGKKYGVSDNTIRKWIKKYQKYKLT